MQDGKFQNPLATLTAADARFTEESSRWQSAVSEGCQCWDASIAIFTVSRIVFNCFKFIVFCRTVIWSIASL